MCNIAGYVGERRAAPILIDMLRREEGFDAGYYTGLATIDNGKIHYRKITGDLDTLLENTDAANLPGNIGIIHGRTKSGGPDAWSHPFVSCGKNGTEPKIAYVANGSVGAFDAMCPQFNKMAEDLIREGYRLDSEIETDDGIYNRLSNGKMVHMSDIMCALIAKNSEQGKTPEQAIIKAFETMPSEIVGLMLSVSDPDKIFYSKINRPMSIAYASHGTYLASTSIAHPDDASLPIVLPALSAGYVSACGFSSTKIENFPAPVCSEDVTVYTKAYRAIEELLSSGEHVFNDMYRVVKPLFPKGAITTAPSVIYETLAALWREGRVKIRKEYVEGARPDLKAPLFKISLYK